MQNSVKASRWTRIRPLVQPTIIRLYKAAGIVTLSLILLGLIAYLGQNLFHYFDRSWVRPVILSPEHQKVVEASTALAEARQRKNEIEIEKMTAQAELAQIDRLVASSEKFEADVAALAAAKTVEAALLRHELDRSVLERQAALERKATLERRIKDDEGRITEQDVVVHRLASSPYIKASEHRKVVAFVPYTNLRNVQPGVSLYGCEWGLVRCSRIGKILNVLDGEVQEADPHDGKVERGLLLEIELSSPRAAEKAVLFAGSKPFWIF